MPPQTDGRPAADSLRPSATRSIICHVDHHGNATKLKAVGRGLIEVHEAGEFVGHVHVEKIREVAARSVDLEPLDEGGSSDGE